MRTLSGETFWENIPLLLGMNFVDIYKLIDDGIDRESARAMDLKLLGNIASVGNYGVNRDGKLGRNFLVGKPLCHVSHYVFFSRRE